MEGTPTKYPESVITYLMLIRKNVREGLQQNSMPRLALAVDELQFLIEKMARESGIEVELDD